MDCTNIFFLCKVTLLVKKKESFADSPLPSSTLAIQAICRILVTFKKGFQSAK